MFSGIVEEVGAVKSVVDSDDGRRICISASEVTTDARVGDSISVNGACLTVIEFSKKDFSVEATWETLRRTTLGRLVEGSKVNLERALRFSDRLGGHLVSGHVDAVGHISKVTDDGFSKIVQFSVDAALAPFFVEKGSVAVEGISLTVVDLIADDDKGLFSFTVALIPHTMSVTTFEDLTLAREVNVETDIIARYVARWLAPSLSALPGAAGLLANINKVAMNEELAVERS
jgi:riboflavin synthase